MAEFAPGGNLLRDVVQRLTGTLRQIVPAELVSQVALQLLNGLDEDDRHKAVEYLLAAPSLAGRAARIDTEGRRVVVERESLISGTVSPATSATGWSSTSMPTASSNTMPVIRVEPSRAIFAATKWAEHPGRALMGAAQ